jgi:hypothetical protein
MIGVALTLFAIAALGGATMAVIRLRGAPYPPVWMALGHGGVAAAGLICFIYEVATASVTGLAYAALGVLILAALGGATLFLGFHLRGKPLPIAFVLGHGLIALIGFAMLAYHHFWMHEVGARP